MTKPHRKIKVLKVDQPLGSFFVASISARDLLELTYSLPAGIDQDKNVYGTQRLEKPERLKEISNYIATKEAAFPNSIILGANYKKNGDLETAEDRRWRVDIVNDGLELIIPTADKLASLIDGQHRLHAFTYCEDDELLDIKLLCAIYIDLPMPFHALIFATINFNQRKVDKSLAYNLFGFDIESSDQNTWVPETVAVSIARQLNYEDTPFKGRISLGLISDDATSGGWKVSLATVVEGILKLISNKPKSDRHNLLKHSLKSRSRMLLSNDNSPLREIYLEGYDEALKEIVLNYFTVVEDKLWGDRNDTDYIKKTVGIQALFEVLREILKDFSSAPNGTIKFFANILDGVEKVNFSDAQASGIGKSYIKKQLLNHIAAKQSSAMEKDKDEIE